MGSMWTLWVYDKKGQAEARTTAPSKLKRAVRANYWPPSSRIQKHACYVPYTSWGPLVRVHKARSYPYCRLNNVGNLTNCCFGPTLI